MTTAAVRTETGEVTWSLETAAPELFALASADVRELISRLREGVPVPPGIDPFDDGAAVRPYRHLRAFYLRVDGGVVAVKGSEPFAPDLQQKLHALGAFRVDYPSRGRSLLSALEHFPIVEQKVPLAVTADEASGDVAASLAFQRAHMATFGALAPVPLPLMTLRWPDSTADALAASLLPLLSPRAATIARDALGRGLACVMYYYPSIPHRVAHLDHELGTAADYPSRRRALAARLDPARTIDSWVELTARMLALGFLPGSIESHGIGHCLEAQNAVIDGGFVDLGSMKPVALARDAREVEETLLMAVVDLSRTVRTFLLGGIIDAEAEYRNPSLVMMEVTGRVWERLRERMTAFDGVDARIARFFARGTLFDELDRGLAALHPALSVGSSHR